MNRTMVGLKSEGAQELFKLFLLFTVAFAKTFDLFEWMQLPFSFNNTPGVFKHTLQKIFNKYKIDFGCNYFDDVIVFFHNDMKKNICCI